MGPHKVNIHSLIHNLGMHVSRRDGSVELRSLKKVFSVKLQVKEGNNTRSIQS
jgi:hypothetical protein